METAATCEKVVCVDSLGWLGGKDELQWLANRCGTGRREASGAGRLLLGVVGSNCVLVESLRKPGIEVEVWTCFICSRNAGVRCGDGTQHWFSGGQGGVYRQG